MKQGVIFPMKMTGMNDSVMKVCIPLRAKFLNPTAKRLMTQKIGVFRITMEKIIFIIAYLCICCRKTACLECTRKLCHKCGKNFQK